MSNSDTEEISSHEIRFIEENLQDFNVLRECIHRHENGKNKTNFRKLFLKHWNLSEAILLQNSWKEAFMKNNKFSSNDCVERIREIIAETKTSNSTSLKASNLEFAAIPATVLQLQQLTQLDLSQNRIRRMGLEFASLTNLQVLNLSHNTLEHIPQFVTRLPNLKIFIAHDISCELLPPDFTDMAALEEFKFEYNLLVDLPDFTKMPKLKHLNLHGNQLGMSASFLYHWPQIKALNIGGNQDLPCPAVEEVQWDSLEKLTVPGHWVFEQNTNFVQELHEKFPKIKVAVDENWNGEDL